MDDFVRSVSHDLRNQRGPSQRTGGGVTHPGQGGPVGSTTSFVKANDVRARYQMFDLTKKSDIEELEDLMTSACYGKALIRDERWSHDKDGLTVVTVSWLDVKPKKKKKAKPPENPEGTARVT